MAQAEAKPIISPAALANALNHPSISRAINRTFRVTDGDVLPTHIRSYGSFAVFKDAVTTIPHGSTVMYDIEGGTWQFTPDQEQANPYFYMGRFVDLAHEHGLKAILAPGIAYRDRAARIPTDIFIAQVQGILNPTLYGKTVCAIAQLQAGKVYAELTANGEEGHTARGLYRQYKAGLKCADGFALWGATDAANLAVASRFLSLVSS
jgi:hypothetical protein